MFDGDENFETLGFGEKLRVDTWNQEVLHPKHGDVR